MCGLGEKRNRIGEVAAEGLDESEAAKDQQREYEAALPGIAPMMVVGMLMEMLPSVTAVLGVRMVLVVLVRVVWMTMLDLMRMRGLGHARPRALA
jgi:hypothetical protein